MKTNKNAKSVTTYTKTNSTHIYKTSSGNYRFRASVNGKKWDKTFNTLKEAREFKSKIIK